MEIAELLEVGLELNASHSTMTLTLSLHHFIYTVTLIDFNRFWIRANTQTKRLIIQNQDVFIKLASRIYNLAKFSKLAARGFRDLWQPAWRHFVSSNLILKR